MTAISDALNPAELRGLLNKAIRLLDQELELLEPGQRVDLIKVLTELRHQITALNTLTKTQGDSESFEHRVLSAIKGVDERLWLEVAKRLEDSNPSGTSETEPGAPAQSEIEG